MQSEVSNFFLADVVDEIKAARDEKNLYAGWCLTLVAEVKRLRAELERAQLALRAVSDDLESDYVAVNGVPMAADAQGADGNICDRCGQRTDGAWDAAHGHSCPVPSIPFTQAYSIPALPIDPEDEALVDTVARRVREVYREIEPEKVLMRVQNDVDPATIAHRDVKPDNVTVVYAHDSDMVEILGAWTDAGQAESICDALNAERRRTESMRPVYGYNFETVERDANTYEAGQRTHSEEDNG